MALALAIAGPKGVDGTMIRRVPPKDLALQKTAREITAHRGKTSYGLNAMAVAATAAAAVAAAAM
jgi:hypothetical protein